MQFIFCLTHGVDITKCMGRPSKSQQAEILNA